MPVDLCLLARHRFLSPRIRAAVEPCICSGDLLDVWEYVSQIIRGPFKLAEPYLAKDPYFAYVYAKYILHGPFPLGEFAIASDDQWTPRYAKYVLHLPREKQVESWRHSVISRKQVMHESQS